MQLLTLTSGLALAVAAALALGGWSHGVGMRQPQKPPVTTTTRVLPYLQPEKLSTVYYLVATERDRIFVRQALTEQMDPGTAVVWHVLVAGSSRMGDILGYLEPLPASLHVLDLRSESERQRFLSHLRMTSAPP